MHKTPLFIMFGYRNDSDSRIVKVSLKDDIDTSKYYPYIKETIYFEDICDCCVHGHPDNECNASSMCELCEYNSKFQPLDINKHPCLNCMSMCKERAARSCPCNTLKSWIKMYED